MKYSKLAVLILSSAAAFLISGCGGTTVNATIGGTVAGLSGGTTVVLVNNGTDPITVGANGTFTFDVQIASGSNYNVTVQTNPIGETCTVTSGSGAVDGDGDQVTSVLVTCDANPV
ncbi:MAG TPA: hypothetical protein VK832_02745 [Burkholderiaceae bacterium]|jgi:hypothetical protein|nr:hypothetical protein [Burkholderiaceae bacterium]